MLPHPLRQSSLYPATSPAVKSDTIRQPNCQYVNVIINSTSYFIIFIISSRTYFLIVSSENVFGCDALPLTSFIASWAVSLMYFNRITETTNAILTIMISEVITMTVHTICSTNYITSRISWRVFVMYKTYFFPSSVCHTPPIVKKL